MEQEIANDELLVNLKSEIEKEGPRGGFTVENGRLVYKGRLVLSRTSQLIPQILKEYHDSVVGGHNGKIKTYLRIASDWFWVAKLPNM